MGILDPVTFSPPRSEAASVDDWLLRWVNLMGIPFQNWMVVTLALILIAALINRGEKK